MRTTGRRRRRQDRRRRAAVVPTDPVGMPPPGSRGDHTGFASNRESWVASVIASTCHNPAVPVHAALLRGINIGPHQRIAMADLRALVDRSRPRLRRDVCAERERGLPVALAQHGCAGGRDREGDRRDARAHGRRRRPKRPGARRDRRGPAVRRPRRRRQAAPRGVPLGRARSRRRPRRSTSRRSRPTRCGSPGATSTCTTRSGAGRSKLSNAFLERSLGVRATSRNWRTVKALAGLTAKG